MSYGLKLGQRVFNCVLQYLYYNLVDMHKLTPNIQEVMAFPNWLSVKQNLPKLQSPESVLYSSVWTLEINTSLASKFM
jgi:hypothetical protein